LPYPIEKPKEECRKRATKGENLYLLTLASPNPDGIATTCHPGDSITAY
jgi:hypothetical protein